MKRIVFTVTTDLSYDQRMKRICTSLAKAGYSVSLVGREREKSVPLEDRPYDQVRLVNRRERGKLFFLEHNWQVFRHLLKHPFDAVCGIDLDTILPCVLAAEIRGKPCVYDAHEIFTEIPELRGRRAVRRVWLEVERYCVPRVQCAYTVNESLASIFRERYGVRFDVIRNISPLRLPEREPDPDRYVFYQGVLNEGRGLPELVRVMKSVDARLLLAGEGDLSGELRDLVRSLGLQEKVIFLGYLEPDELVPVMEGASAAVNLRNRGALNDYYSLANKFFDYVHAGVPQVTMRFPEYERVNREHEVALLLDDLSEESIRGALVRLLEDGELYRRIRAACADARRVYCWENEEERLLAIYRELFASAD